MRDMLELQQRFTQTNVPNNLMIDYIFAWNVVDLSFELINFQLIMHTLFVRSLIHSLGART